MLNHGNRKQALICHQIRELWFSLQFTLQCMPHISPVFLKYIFSVLQTYHVFSLEFHTDFSLYPPHLSPAHSFSWLTTSDLILTILSSEKILTVPGAPVAAHTSTMARAHLNCNCLLLFFLLCYVVSVPRPNYTLFSYCSPLPGI